MKLFFDNFKAVYEEFAALSELTTEILQSMGIILLKSLTPVASNGLHTNRFSEFDDDDDDDEYEDDEDEAEAHMEEEGLYSGDGVGVLQIQMHDESNGNILVPKDAADEEEDLDFSVDKIASSGHSASDKQQPAAPFESTAGDKSFGEVVKKEDLRLALDEEVTGDVKFGTFNKKYTATSGNTENSPLVD